jgi:hypothetical protein
MPVRREVRLFTLPFVLPHGCAAGQQDLFGPCRRQAPGFL